ncbi:MAG: riboflavin biosynthesis protein RibD [Bacteroidetes bacterium GWF2_42_66]|nr:MAG: riboflavin biosynthesis protein RibD [Bacteroidetes bacterium GWA2_42_15]OFY01832.1 MAG: riboflavin biosynthesis protein RibD [Bacteroidetes bacterium GWE2_42_39]OFY44874.1 MAG: riboflavin biosynthesis protein RibD [Bacteroidetes bacterium GWF2_42_66]HBL76002.1 bifunctional diaminohydroxyphosphoribosylaminopyrimidine deaminase/5-amino-6-(5-phosphoribosylamino)uracil reductase RibD [Prolixibacteraceae bacterium]HCR89952.1 bifunctional diaminohydroxyphosphoribosylaminopyrimidine deaminase
MATDQKYMQRSLELAALGLGDVAPNPMVGCVVVHDGKIIGEGYHQKYGDAHAEVNAIRSVKNKELLSESTLYVTLEPCAHFGKTPPCSDLIIENRIPKVVVGTIDPFAEVAGKGIEKMRKAGIDVEVGMLENECRELNRRFFTFHEKKRPYIFLKWAQTADGFIDRERNGNGEKPAWITNELARRLVHKQRSEEAAILIGTNTAEKDNPSLTVREWKGNQPYRMTLDRTGRLSPDLHLFDGAAPTVIFTATEAEPKTLVEFVPIDFSNDPLPLIMDHLYRNNIQSVIIEGGARLLTSVISSGLWDEAHVYFGNQFFGKGIKAPQISGKIIDVEQLDECRLTVMRNADK